MQLIQSDSQSQPKSLTLFLKPAFRLIARLSLALALLISPGIATSVFAADAGYVMPGEMTTALLPDDIDMDSLARLPQVQRDDLDEYGREVFDLWVRPGTGYGTGLRGPVGMWMHSPQLAQGVFPLRQRVRYESDKDQRLTELAIIATAREINNQYEYSAHEPLAITAGLEQGIIDLVKFRRPLSEGANLAGFGNEERVIIRFTREVISEEKVSTATFNEALDIFGREGVMDLVGLIGYYNFVAITLKAFDVQRPPGTTLLLPVAAP